MTDIEQHKRIEVFVGIDVGKGAHHAVALDLTGKRLLDSALPNDEAKLRALITKLKEHGHMLLVVDRPATIGPLPVAVARAEGVAVAYLPGLAMRRIVDLHAGEAKTDARDAYIIAEAARSMPHTLRLLKLADNEVAELTMLCGFDDDLAGQITQTSNRIRGLLTQIHPALERVIGPRLIERHPSPAQLARLSEKQLASRLVKLAPRMGSVGLLRSSKRSRNKPSWCWALRPPPSSCHAWRNSLQHCDDSATKSGRKSSDWSLHILFIRS